MKSPAFRFYPSDFISSPTVQAMDLHEVGAYMLLLCTAWVSERHGYLPDDEEMLRRWARMTREQWTQSRGLILGRFPVAEDGWRANPRMVEEAEKQAAYSESQSAKGKMGGRPKKAGGKPEVSEGKAGASKTESPEKPSVSVSVSVSDKSKESKSAEAQTPSPDFKTVSSNSPKPDSPATAEELMGTGLEPDDFTAYMAVRRRKRWTFIDSATRERWIAKFRKFYAEGKDTTDMLHQMIEGQWQGIVAEKWKQRPAAYRVLTDAEEIWPELMGRPQ